MPPRDSHMSQGRRHEAPRSRKRTWSGPKKTPEVAQIDPTWVQNGPKGPKIGVTRAKIRAKMVTK